MLILDDKNISYLRGERDLDLDFLPLDLDLLYRKGGVLDVLLDRLRLLLKNIRDQFLANIY